MKLVATLCLLFATSAYAGGATRCKAHFGFSPWQATLDEANQELYVASLSKDQYPIIHGRYVDTQRTHETRYFVAYDFGKGVSLTVRGDEMVLCLDATTCSPCKPY